MSSKVATETTPNGMSNSEALYNRACKVMPGGNTRDTIFFPPYPLYASHGQGCYVTDVEGVERIDFVNNYSALIHGHRNTQIEEAAQQQLARLPAVGLPTESEIRLAELLCDQIASVERIRFTNSGTEAIMMALKAARLFTGRNKIAKVEGAYHGSYDWIEVSVAPEPSRFGPVSSPASVARSSAVTPAVCDEVVVISYNDVEGTRARIEAEAENLAAVLIDPLVSRMGYTAATADYLEMLREVTERHGILLVFDEIYTLRLAAGGLQSARGIKPDLTALGKIIGGCFPVGAFGGRADVMEVFNPSRGSPRLPHGGTYNANPMSMAAGYASMKQLTAEAYAHLDRLGDRARQGLSKVLEDAGVDAQVTGEGSVLAVVPTRTPIHSWREFVVCEGRGDRLAAFHRHMLDNGILMATHGTFVLSTPMTVTEIDTMVDAARKGAHLLQ